MNRKKNITVKLISYLSALFIVMGGYIITGYNTARKTAEFVKNSYNSSLTELSDYMENITLNLQKELYAQSPEQLASLANKLSADAACAKSALERLPVSTEYTSGIYRFLSQAGDYSAYLARQAANSIGDTEHKQLLNLYKYSDRLSGDISDVQALAAESDYWGGEIKSALKNAADKAESSLSSLNSSAKDISQTNTDYPKLIYDGPFSDHMMSGSAKFLEGKTTVNLQGAKQLAANYIGCDNRDVKYQSTDDGNIRTYTYICGTKQIGITERGGALMYISDSREVNSRKITEDEAIRLANKYLTDKFKLNFKQSYYMINDNICVINFAYLQDSVICYPDLVKVGVALDNGEIISVEAGGFVSNHRTRELSFKHSENDAKSALSNNLMLKQAQKCVINLGTDKEYCCYEFLCTGENNEQLLVYVDADNLITRNILILQITDGGTLTR